MLNKTVWLLWLQRWENAPWLIKQVAESWEINNPDWKIEYVTLDNLHTYVNDIDYLFDNTKKIESQAKSDIIRLSLLKNHGGVWADATLLCMQPLSSWVEEAVKPAGIWMYHGTGGAMPKHGPASWFIVAEKESSMISKWKAACDEYWRNRTEADQYFWLDELFKDLYESDGEFRHQWNLVPYLYCLEKGQSSTMFVKNHVKNQFRLMITDNQYLKNIFLEKPPYVLKFWWRIWLEAFPDENSPECKNSNGYYAIQMSKRKFIYKHKMMTKTSYMNLIFDIEKYRFRTLRVIKRSIKKLLKIRT